MTRFLASRAVVSACLAALLGCNGILGDTPAPPPAPVDPPALAAALMGGTITNGSTQGLLQGFLFEPEVPMASLKSTPTWNELEQLLDNPYRVTLCASLPDAPPLIQGTPGAGSGITPGVGPEYPSYCTDPARFTRRPAFGVTLPPLLVDPLNYNPTTGEEMRLLNQAFPGGEFDATSMCESLDATPCTPEPTTITVSPGAGRIGDDGAAIDYNTPLARDTPVCILSTETPEGVALCGGDPGEPNYFGFGVLDDTGYSTPAVPGVLSASDPIPASARLFDQARGVIEPRNPITGVGGLRKPSLRIPGDGGRIGGTPNNPNYLVNSVARLAANPAALVPSSENDYVRNRATAIQLGKALLWDMQVGSDGVQSCGTCHFHAGADNRTKNTLNPNHLGPQGFAAKLDLKGVNTELVVDDFPLHKLADPEVAGDPACVDPIMAFIDPGVLENNFPGGVANFTVCSAANILKDTDDVVSSMGVHFGKFGDVPVPGPASFNPPTSGVASLKPDLRAPVDPITGVDPNIDPIADFAGATGNEFRRVEPRNTPTVFLADLNFDNFWDARARHDFNGGSPFGAADPQSHVYVNNVFNLSATRQIIRFDSLASLALGPGLSEFEMSFLGRNWAKVGKKLLQGSVTPSATSVTPLANQLVATDDSVLGIWSNQGGATCLALGRPTAVGMPGLCTTYRELIQLAYFPALWENTGRHLNGTSAPCTSALNGVVTPAGCDPFDGYKLAIATGPASPTNTNQFTQQEANFGLFWGMSIHLWATILVPDDTPLDQFLDLNPEAFEALGESGEAGLVADMPTCTTATERHCVREVGLFKRDPQPDRPGFGGTRAPSDPDPLLGLDVFEGSNLSLKNPNFRSARCGECHALPSLTDNTMPFTFKAQLRDFVGEFLAPGAENSIEPLGRLRLISGFLLESEMNENGQDGVERRIANQSIVPNPTDGLAYPDGLLRADGSVNGPDFKGSGQSFFDNGVYNIGVRPIAEDIGRGGLDAFGWPLSLAGLLLKNLGGPAFEPGVPLSTFACASDPCDPVADQTGGLYEETAQDQQINPGFGGEIVNPLLPPYLAPWVNEINVGDGQPELDEVFGGVNTLTDVPVLEGFVDTLGPFNPAGILPEVLNRGDGPLMGTWPVVNRVGRNGSFKAAQLREVELTGPYFHNGGKLTLRQVVDFYTRGGDFPVTNGPHRDFNIMHQSIEVQSNLNEDEKVALVDFLLSLTDDRVRFERAPFDRPQMIVPLDGKAPENVSGRDAMLTDCVDLPVPEGRVCAGGMFRDVPAVGAGGNPASAPLPNFLGIAGIDAATGRPAKRLVGAAAFCKTIDSQYCH
jgi:cytochrome c peroxidase